MTKTMKKYFVYLASAALLLACNKEEINTPVDNTPVDTPAATELITVDLNPATKTALEGMNTKWVKGDKVSVTVGGKKIGTLDLVEGNTFSGEIEAGHDGEAAAVLNYPDGVAAVPTTQAATAGTFANGAALLEGTTTIADLRAGTGATLQNQTALLQFQTPVAGDVAFTIGSTTYTVTGCETGKTYYACVDPENTGKLTYTVGIVLGGKEASSFTPVSNKIHPLGTLTLKESQYGVIGNTGDWGDKADIKMYETTGDNFYVAYGVEVTSGFKVRKAGAWDDNYNFGTTSNTAKSANSIVGVYTDGGSTDINVTNGTYDIYFDRLAGQVYIMTPGTSHETATKPTTTSYYSLAGSFTGGGWNDTVAMKYSGDGIWTNVQTFAANDEFKIKNKGNWDASWGYDNVYPGSGLVSKSDGNAKVKTAGTYVVGFYKEGNKITLVKK